MTGTPMLRTLIVVLAVALQGCVFSREMSALKHDIERSNPQLELRRNVVLNVGSGTIHILESLARLSEIDEALFAAEFLHDVDRVKVGIYDVRLRDDVPTELRGLDRLRGGGWEVALVVRGDDELAYVLYRERGNHIRDLYLISLDVDQLVALRFSGNVQRILARAIQYREDLAQRRIPAAAALHEDGR